MPPNTTLSNSILQCSGLSVCVLSLCFFWISDLLCCVFVFMSFQLSLSVFLLFPVNFFLCHSKFVHLFILLGMAVMPIPLLFDGCMAIISCYTLEVSLLSFSIKVPITYFKKLKYCIKCNLAFIVIIILKYLKGKYK